MAKSQSGKTSKGTQPPRPKAGTCKSLASPDSKKATKESQKFIDDIFSKPVKAPLPAGEKLGSTKGSTAEQARAAGNGKVCRHSALLSKAAYRRVHHSAQ